MSSNPLSPNEAALDFITRLSRMLPHGGQAHKLTVLARAELKAILSTETERHPRQARRAKGAAVLVATSRGGLS